MTDSHLNSNSFERSAGSVERTPDSSPLRTPAPSEAVQVQVPLRSKLARLIVLVALPMLLALGVLAWVGGRLDHTSTVRERERIYFNLINDLKYALVNVESGVRGYALTRDDSFLAPYREGRAQIDRVLLGLRQDPALVPERDLLEGDVQGFLDDWAAQGIQRADALEGLPRAERDALFRTGKVRLDGLRASLNTLDQGSLTRRTAARLEQEGLIRTVAVLSWVLLGLVVLGLVVLFRALSSGVVRPLMRLTTAVQALERGEQGVRAQVHSNDEVGVLAQAFNHSSEALEARTAELERSNRELEQFAYVASHDLQEPLRMVSSYTQLLKKRYAGKLDGKADQYIDFAVDGAERMQRLIQDLLAFSRIGTQPGHPDQVSSKAVLHEVLRSLELAIRDSGGEVRVEGELPEVWADRRQLAQVFQNLISNGLKFRREGVPPLVRVLGALEQEAVRFSVSDNGIGIEPDYFERIFVIFQRLHGKQEFSGSGIGLAIVKKIVERHGGRLWLESTPGQGSTFHFTLPRTTPQEHL